MQICKQQSEIKDAIVEYLDYQTAKGTKGKWRYASSEIGMRHLPAISIYGYVETNTQSADFVYSYYH